jgi:ABC-type multidrug transport system ATPase subunit
VLVATSDLDEALEVGDRIVVLNHGRLAADLPLADATRERLIDAMSARPPTSAEVAVGITGSTGTTAEPAGMARAAGEEAGP